MVGTTDASTSTISGTGIASSIYALTAYTITVTAKDSAGNSIGHGGDIFLIQITNKWTTSVEYVCDLVSGARSTVSTPYYDKMIDNGDGTYSYSYTLSNDGAITVIVKLSTGNGVYSEWYPNTSWSAPTCKTNISSNIYFDYWGGINWTNLPTVGASYFSAYLYSTIIPSTTETYTFTYCWDDGPAYILMNSVTTYMANGWNSFSLSLTSGKPYDFRFKWFNTFGNAILKLYWSTSTISNQFIPSNYYYVMRNVGSSPIQISVSWPTGYSSGQPSYTNLCHEIWGDGIKVGSEQCDDGNTINNDGCQSDCTLITPGFAWTGGGTDSKDVWTQCLSGYTQNSDKTAWIPIWGDGLKMPTESCDDGNTSNGDGWSSVWSIESGYSCTGGSPTSKDTWIVWSVGYIQDVSNPTNWITNWGDGLRTSSEEWDDANTSSGDGCSSSWTIESQYIWNGGSITSKDTWTKWTSGYYQNSSKTQCITTWGDGFKAGSEKCDDGNTLNGDGWKSDWSAVESGWVCSGGSTTSKDIWTKWDKWYYQNDPSNPTSCIPKWGDGMRVGYEHWDDGNTVSGDGWSSDWMNIEDGWACFGGYFGVTDVWVQWDLGYNPNPDYSTWIGAEVPRDIKATAAAVQAAAFMGVATNLILTVFSSSSSSSSNSFGMLNQIQLVILLPLIGAYIPEKNLWLLKVYECKFT